MANFKPIMLADARIQSYPLKCGQLLISTDTYGIYLDTSDTERKLISQIIRITESERNDMLVPVIGFYYITDTNKLYYYYNEWILVGGEEISIVKSDNNGYLKVNGQDILIYSDDALVNHVGNNSNPHKVTKSQVGLSKVENMSSSDIIASITYDDIVNALGYEPPMQDTTYKAATPTTLGLIKSGDHISVSSDGTATVIGGNATQLAKAVSISLSGAVTGSVSFNGSKDVDISTALSSVPASKITGILSIDNIPQGALERCVPVANDGERFALTTDDIQKGDVVKVGTGENAIMYYVKDDTKLNSEEGYEPFSAGIAASVPWTGVTGKPTTFTPSEHNHTVSEISDFPTSMPASDVYDWAKSPSKPTYASSEVGLGNVTNDKQIKGLSSGTTENHIIVFGADGYTVKDSGHTIGTSVPENAVFTDTVYELPVATQNALGGILSGNDVSVSDTGAVTVNSASKLRTGVKIGEANFDGSKDITLDEMGIKNPIEVTRAKYDALKASGNLNMEAYYNITDDYDSVGLIDDVTPATNQVFSSSKVEETYSKKSQLVNTTLTVANWVGDSAPYTYTLSVDGITATNINEIFYDSTAPDEAITAYQEAGLRDGGQSTGQLVIKATEQKPTVDIPIKLIIRHDI